MKIKYSILSFFITLFLVAPVAVFAQTGNETGSTDADTLLNGNINGAASAVVQKSNLNTTAGVFDIIGNTINILLGLLGLIALLLTLYSGFQWMTAGGDTKKIDSAKARLKNAVIGMVIILTSFIISNFVISLITRATTKTETPSAQPAKPQTPLISPNNDVPA